MKKSASNSGSCPLKNSEMVKYRGGFLFPFLYYRTIVKAAELGEKLMEWLTTEH